VFVTHDVNPVLAVADRVLYLAPGRWAAGAPAEVLTGSTLSRLYGTPVEVLSLGERLVVVGTPEDGGTHHHDHDHDGGGGA
jgi:zinc/manganese transport system ATP-binding protein